MHPMFAPVAAVPLFVAYAAAAASYPAKPKDLTTPVQQRIAVNGANCSCHNYYELLLHLANLPL
jgi:hypothetical protein